MRTFKCNFYFLFLVFLLYMLIFGSCSLARRVHVHVINRLPDGFPMTIHCQSRDNDLGQSIVEVGDEVNWSFRINFWGTTLFYCEVQWESDSSIWYHFDAYDDDRDFQRCRSECLWMISREGFLYGYDQESEYWELFAFTKHEFS